MWPKWKTNEVIKAVEAGGLDRRDCAYDFGTSSARITHPGSGSWFALHDRDTGGYEITTVVGDLPPHGPLPFPLFSTIPGRIERWAKEVKTDVDTPNLWAELQAERELLGGASYDRVENTPFTSAEQAVVARHLSDLQQYVLDTYQVTDELRTLVEARFDDLKRTSRTAGRRDWGMMLGGALFGLILQQVVPPDSVPSLVVLAFHGLHHLLGGGGPAPPLPPGSGS